MAQKLGEREMRTATRSSERLKELIGQTKSADRTRGRRLQLPGESRDSERELDAINQEIRQLEHELHKERADKNRKRQKRRRKKQQSMAEDIFKLSALIIGLVLLVVFCIHDGAYDDFDIERSVSYQSVDKQQSTFVQQYLSYQNDAAHNPGLGGRTTVDLSEIYVDAAGVVPASKGVIIDTESGTPITVGGPTRDLTSAAYVVNIEQLAVWMYQDIIDSETARGITPTKTAQECAREKMTTGILFSKETDVSTTSLSGAVGPAITRRDYLANHLWTEKSITQAETHYKAFPGGVKDNAYIDIMFVPLDEVDKYYDGEDTTVYYVSWRVNDVKAHSAPWGLAQTNIHFSYDGPRVQFGLLDGRYGAAKPDGTMYGDSDYVAVTPRTEDTGESFHNLVSEYLKQTLPTYRAPAVSASAAELNNPKYTGLQEIFEYRNNEHWVAFQKWYSQMKNSSGLACVGVLVYAEEDLTPADGGGG